MSSRVPSQCLIANRGEIAVRIIRACRELGILTVAVYSDVDANARHVQLANRAFAVNSYLDGAKLIEVATTAGCQYVHPGYGFLSESEDFAQAVLDAGLIWVGPGPEAIRSMGVKTQARDLMMQAGVPLVPGFQSDSDAELIAAASDIGYPVMVKASGGGGGKGIRIVHHLADLTEALAAARREAQHAFGDPRVFLEKYIEHARHVEIQLLADSAGNVIHLFERECSAQRRHQKIVEESPSPFLNPALRQRIGQAAVSAARAVGYVNAGTVEFIVTPDGDFYFLEMNTRLQVEHPVTELVTGLDIVKLQFAIAAGGTLPVTQADVTQRGHAIECRIYAEDPANNFLPAVGTIVSFIAPEGPGIRVDSGVQSGDDITIHYDPLIAKIIVHDSTRQATIERMQRALADTVILGTTTNREFLQALLAHPAFLAGRIDTQFVDAKLESLLADSPSLPDTALIAAALHDNDAGTSRQLAPADDNPWARADGFRPGGSAE